MANGSNRPSLGPIIQAPNKEEKPATKWMQQVPETSINPSLYRNPYPKVHP